MASKTYLPGLYLVAKALYTYMTRWQTQLQENASSEQQLAISECLTCVTHLLTLVTKPPEFP